MQRVPFAAAVHNEITDDFGRGKRRTGLDADPARIAQETAVAAEFSEERQLVTGQGAQNKIAHDSPASHHLRCSRNFC